MSTNISNDQQFRLNKINELMSKNLSKYIVSS